MKPSSPSDPKPTWVVGSPIPPESRLSTLIEGEYRVNSILGQGELGVTYQAFNPRLKRNFAILMLKRELSPTTEMMLAVRADLRRAHELSALGLMPVKQVTDADGVPGLATEMLDGESLRQRLLRGALPPERALGLLIYLGKALSAAHGLGMLHGDLRPENIFLVRPGAKGPYAGRPVLLEHSVHHLRRRPVGFDDTLPLGKLMYRPPEQVAGEVEAADTGGDIFTLGAILHECLTGVAAFGGPDVEAVLDNLSRPPPLLEANPRTGLSASLCEALNVVIAGACSRQPQARVPAMDDLVRVLVQVADGAGLVLPETLSESPPPGTAPVGRMSRLLQRLSGVFPVVAQRPPPERRPEAQQASSAAIAPVQKEAPAAQKTGKDGSGVAVARPLGAVPSDSPAPRPVETPAVSGGESAGQPPDSTASTAAEVQGGGPSGGSMAVEVPSGGTGSGLTAAGVQGGGSTAAEAPASMAAVASSSTASPTAAEGATTSSDPAAGTPAHEPAHEPANENDIAASAAPAQSPDAPPSPPYAAPTPASLPLAAVASLSGMASRTDGPRQAPATLPISAARGSSVSGGSAVALPGIALPPTLPPNRALPPQTLPKPLGEQSTRPPKGRAAVDLAAAPIVTRSGPDNRPTQALPFSSRPVAVPPPPKLATDPTPPISERATRPMRARDITQLVLAVQQGRLDPSQAVALAREPEDIPLDALDLLPVERPTIRPLARPTVATDVQKPRPEPPTELRRFLLQHQEVVAALGGALLMLLGGLLFMWFRS